MCHLTHLPLCPGQTSFQNEPNNLHASPKQLLEKTTQMGWRAPSKQPSFHSLRWVPTSSFFSDLHNYFPTLSPLVASSQLHWKMESIKDDVVKMFPPRALWSIEQFVAYLLVTGPIPFRQFSRRTLPGRGLPPAGKLIICFWNLFYRQWEKMLWVCKFTNVLSFTDLSQKTSGNACARSGFYRKRGWARGVMCVGLPHSEELSCPTAKCPILGTSLSSFGCE